MAQTQLCGATPRVPQPAPISQPLWAPHQTTSSQSEARKLCHHQSPGRHLSSQSRWGHGLQRQWQPASTHGCPHLVGQRRQVVAFWGTTAPHHCPVHPGGAGSGPGRPWQRGRRPPGAWLCLPLASQCHGSTSTPTCPAGLCARGAPRLRFLHEILKIKCNTASRGVCPQPPRTSKVASSACKRRCPERCRTPKPPGSALPAAPVCPHAPPGPPLPLAPALGFGSPSAEE